MKNQVLLLASLACCTAQVALADGNPYFISCSTESAGLQFSRSERDPSLARQLTTQDCTSNQSTLNSECTANLWCNDQNAYPPAMISCETDSAGLQFNHATRDENLSRQLAITACTANQSTNNAECNANVTCNDGTYQPQEVSCVTDSNGLQFQHEDRDATLASTLAQQACTQNQTTLNSECSANLWCSNQGPAPRRYTCNTVSNGLQFTHDGLNQDLTRTLALQACTQNQTTNNAECNANVFCVGGGPQI